MGIPPKCQMPILFIDTFFFTFPLPPPPPTLRHVNDLINGLSSWAVLSSYTYHPQVLSVLSFSHLKLPVKPNTPSSSHSPNLCPMNVMIAGVSLKLSDVILSRRTKHSMSEDEFSGWDNFLSFTLCLSRDIIFLCMHVRPTRRVMTLLCVRQSLMLSLLDRDEGCTLFMASHATFYELYSASEWDNLWVCVFGESSTRLAEAISNKDAYGITNPSTGRSWQDGR